MQCDKSSSFVPSCILRAFISNSLKWFCYSFSFSSQVIAVNVDFFIFLSLINFVCCLASNCWFLVVHCNVDFISFALQVFRLVSAICFSERLFWILPGVCVEPLMSTLQWNDMKWNPLSYMMLCAIWCHLHNLENLKNTHGGVLLLVKSQALFSSWKTMNVFLRVRKIFSQISVSFSKEDQS